MLNNVIVMGRMVATPELRTTPTGTPVTNFSIACDRDFVSSNGIKVVDFFDVVAWRQTAEFASKYFTKGRMAVIEGRIQVREWKDKDGNGRRTVEIAAENIYFGDSKRDSDSAPASGGFSAIADDDYGEIPF